MRVSARLVACAAAVLASCALPFVEATDGPGRDGSRASPLSNPRQLTFDGRRSGEGYFSADGSKLVFQSEREPGNPFYQIYWLDLESGHVHRVSPGHGKTTCAWIHPDGDRVLFASTHEDPEARSKQARELEFRASGRTRRYEWDYDEHFDLFAAGVSGEAPRNLTRTHGYDAEGSWSPDGRSLVFASNRHAFAEPLSEDERALLERDPSYFVELYRMNADGSDVRRLTRTPGYDGGPFFSPDGERIVWRRFSADGERAEIHIMNADGSDPHPITRLGAMSWAPYFHPSGDYVVFTTNLHGYGNFELYMVDAAGARDPVRVTDSDGFDGLAAFAPDGRSLAWTRRSAPGRGAQLFLADWDDGLAREQLGLPAAPRTIRAARDEAASRVAIEPVRLRAHVKQLASQEFDGRLTGSRGEELATEYVAERFRELGLEPAGDDGDFFQTFEFAAGVSLGAGNELWAGERDAADPGFDVATAWLPLAFSAVGDVEPSEVVFAGYGIVAPASDRFEPMDSYADLDVAGRWVLVLRYLPEGIDTQRRQYLRRFSGLRRKAMVARDRGARGLIVASGPRARVRDELVRLAPDRMIASMSIAAVTVTDALAGELLRPSGRDLAEIQEQLDGGDAAQGFPLAGVRLGARIRLEQEQRAGRNVLARLPALSGRGRPAVVIGAHVDHLGHGNASNSLARQHERGEIHYGADDNASGVAALLEVARQLVARARSGELTLVRDVIFAAWSGEELGLLGSSHFAASLEPETGAGASIASHVAAYLNMDMVGRFAEHVSLYGVGSSSLWRSEIERSGAPLSLAIIPQDDAYLATDSTVFYLKGVPVLSAFTGAHEDYHSPRDTAERVNYEGVAAIAELMARLTARVAARTETPDYLAMDRPHRLPLRAGLRVYLGTVPDYARSAELGVGLSGVVKGGPAERAGVRSGDVVVEINGTRVENIYDYTYALDALRIGEPVTIRVRRGASELDLTVTPASRD